MIDEKRTQRVMELIDAAIHSGTLVAVECTDKLTEKPVTVLAEQYIDDKTGNTALRPLTMLFVGDPNDEVIPPGEAISVYGKTGAEALAQAFPATTQA